MQTIGDAVSEVEIGSCFPVMKQLRDHIQESSFIEQVMRQQKEGYVLTSARRDSEVVGVVGWRLRENLSMGRHLYIDDLVVRQDLRRKTIGKELLRYVFDRASKEGCTVALLDSGVQRFPAHRFYLREGFDIRAYLFMRTLT